jgi:hypothetical protein
MSFFKFLNRVLHKDEKTLGRKHIYLPHAQTAIYDSEVNLFLKQGISHQLGEISCGPMVIFLSGQWKFQNRKSDWLLEYFS